MAHTPLAYASPTATRIAADLTIIGGSGPLSKRAERTAPLVVL